MRVKFMSFDYSTSLDIISADRRCFGATKNWVPRVTTPTQDRYFFLCVLNLSEIEHQTYW